MNAVLTTTGIDQITVEPRWANVWRVRFRSNHVGMHHQMYVNGRLTDWSDLPEQRSFLLDAAMLPAVVCIAAVPEAQRAEDLSEQLSSEHRRPSWLYRPVLARPVDLVRGVTIRVLGDHATGQVSEEPLATTEVWPEWLGRWNFGEDAFGRGGFGYDGANAPGLGSGAFGGGPFGMDTDLLALEALLSEEGTHTIVLRTLTPDGQVADAEPVNVEADPPPQPASDISATGYDAQNQQLTLEIG